MAKESQAEKHLASRAGEEIPGGYCAKGWDDDVVYEPQEDSFMLLKHIKDYAKPGMSVLDMGTGSGILALEAAKYAKSVLAADTDENAVKHTADKIKNGGISNATAIKSDLFSVISRKIRFGLIMFNPPYLPSDPDYPHCALDGGKNGYEVIFQFLEKAGQHLEKEGVILLLFSSLSGKEEIDRKIIDCGFSSEEVEKRKFAFEELYLYALRHAGTMAKESSTE